jgi:hypothetical protein
MDKLLQLKNRAIEAIEDFNAANRAVHADSRETTERELLKTAATSCAFQEAYSIMADISNDAAAEMLHREARLKDLARLIHDTDASPHKQNADEIKTYKERRTEYEKLLKEKAAVI